MGFKKKGEQLSILACRCPRERPYAKWKKSDVIDPLEIQELAAIGCSQRTISELYGMNIQTLQLRYIDEYKYGRAIWKKIHHRKQTDLAMAGNVPLLIHFARTVLGQKESEDEPTNKPQAIDMLQQIAEASQKMVKDEST